MPFRSISKNITFHWNETFTSKLSGRQTVLHGVIEFYMQKLHFEIYSELFSDLNYVLLFGNYVLFKKDSWLDRPCRKIKVRQFFFILSILGPRLPSLFNYDQLWSTMSSSTALIVWLHLRIVNSLVSGFLFFSFAIHKNGWILFLKFEKGH